MKSNNDSHSNLVQSEHNVSKDVSYSKSIGNKLKASKNISDLAEEFNHESPSTLLKENEMLKQLNKQLESKLKLYENNSKFSQKQILEISNQPKENKKSDSNLIN